METLSGSIEKIISALAEKRKDEDSQIYSQWPKIVGNLFARHCCPADLREGTLIINAESSAWMYMLRLRQSQILEKVNKISTQEIKAIKLRIGKIF